MPRPSLVTLLALLLGLGSTAASAVPSAAREREARVIVKLRAAEGAAADDAERLRSVGARQGVAGLQLRRGLGDRTRVVTARGVASRDLAQRLSADGEVAYAVPDRRVRRAALPNDPRYASGGVNGPAVGQWYLKPASATTPAATDAQTAWDTTLGSPSVVVAVLDTGVRYDHPDLASTSSGGKLLPGYDFVRDTAIANDGDGRDDSASDPGDYVTAADIDNGVVEDDCVIEPSSWHGTQVAGIVGALTNNGVGMAGAGWSTRVLPVRVLGKCGGFESDIVAAMRWSVGLQVDGVPTNPNPAKVLNLSLGGDGDCDAPYRDALDAVTAAGALVVASAGNTAGHALASPANCAGVLAVAGLRHIGTKVGFSDLGSQVAVSAPAGNCVTIDPDLPCQYPILTTTNTGLRDPVASTFSDSFDATVGTSFSAPLVSAAAALVWAYRPTLDAAEVRAALQTGARAFPSSGAAAGTAQCTAPQFDAGGNPVDQDECYCTTRTCGAGMLNMAGAVGAASGPLARIDISPAQPRAGETITLDARGSRLPAGRTLQAASWTLMDGGGIVTALAGPTNASTSSLRANGPGWVTLQLVVTDNSGARSRVTRTVEVLAATPSSGGDGGGGGGGALGIGYLLALAGAVLAARRAVRGHDIRR